MFKLTLFKIILSVLLPFIGSQNQTPSCRKGKLHHSHFTELKKTYTGPQGCESIFSYVWHPHWTLTRLHPCDELPNPLRTHSLPVFLKKDLSFIIETLYKSVQTTFLLFILNVYIWHIKAHLDRIFFPSFQWYQSQNQSEGRCLFCFYYSAEHSILCNLQWRGTREVQHQLPRKYQKLITTLLNFNPQPTQE